jgi:hypothetical protein
LARVCVYGLAPHGGDAGRGPYIDLGDGKPLRVGKAER